MTRMIVLAGAPEQSKLDWSEKSLSPVTHLENVAQSPESVTPAPRGFTASWRQLNTEKLQMRPILPKLDIGRPPPSAVDTQPTQSNMQFKLTVATLLFSGLLGLVAAQRECGESAWDVSARSTPECSA